MTQTIMAVTYRLTETARQNDAQALKQQFEGAAALIAAVPGLGWKISAIDADQGVGLGVYLFDTDVAAHDFANGALIGRLRHTSGIDDLRIIRAPVLRRASLAMGAARAIGAEPQTDAAGQPAVSAGTGR